MSEEYEGDREQRELFARARKLVMALPDRFMDAGAALDARYSESGIRRYEAEQKRYWWKAGGAARRASADAFAETRARLRRIYGLHTEWRSRKSNEGKGDNDELTIEAYFDRPELRRRGEDGRWYRVGKIRMARFVMAFDDTLQAAEELPLDRRMRADRLAFAERVVLITWLLTDPDAHEHRPIVSQFQDWCWDPPGSHDEPGKPVLWVSPEVQREAPAPRIENGVIVPDCDYFAGRHQTRTVLLDREHCAKRWLRVLEAAVSILESEIPPVQQGAKQSRQRSRGGGAMVKWKLAQKRMLTLYGKGNLPKTLRQAAKLLASEGFKYGTVRLAVHKSSTLTTYFDVNATSPADRDPGNILDELVSQAEPVTKKWLKSLPPESFQKLGREIAKLEPRKRLELISTLATSSDGGSTGDFALIEEVDRDIWDEDERDHIE